MTRVDFQCLLLGGVESVNQNGYKHECYKLCLEKHLYIQKLEKPHKSFSFLFLFLFFLESLLHFKGKRQRQREKGRDSQPKTDRQTHRASNRSADNFGRARSKA